MRTSSKRLLAYLAYLVALLWATWMWVGTAYADAIYTVSINSFTYNGITYPADTFTFETQEFIQDALPSSSTLLQPATYDGYTFRQVGSMAWEEINGVTWHVIGSPYNGDNQSANGSPYGPAPVGAIEGWSTPFLSPTLFASGAQVSGQFIVAVNVRSGAEWGEIHGVQVFGTISRMDPPAPVGGAVPEPPPWMLLIIGLGLMLGVSYESPKLKSRVRRLISPPFRYFRLQHLRWVRSYRDHWSDYQW